MSLCSANTVDECVLNSESLGRNIFRKGPSPYDWFRTNGLNTRFIEKETIFTKTLNWRLKVKERQTFSSLDLFHSISRVHALYQRSHLRLPSRCYYDHNCTVIWGCRDHTRRRARVYLSKHLKTSNTRRWPNVFSHEELIVLRFTKFETFRINFIYAGNFTLESVNRQLPTRFVWQIPLDLFALACAFHLKRYATPLAFGRIKFTPSWKKVTFDRK